MSSSNTGNPLMVGGPQIGYFYPGLTYEIDMQAPGSGLARRHVRAVPRLPAHRARRGLLDDADLGVRATSSTSTSRSSAAAATPSTSTRASAATWAPSTPARSAASPSRSTPRSTGRFSGYATVKGKRVAISSEALELRQGRARPALQPQAVERLDPRPGGLLPGGFEDSADVQLVLHRRQERRRVHRRPAADPLGQDRSRACRPGAPASTSGRASSVASSTRRASTPRTGR